MSETPKPRLREWSFRFSLKALLIILAFVAVCLAIVSSRVSQHRIELRKQAGLTETFSVTVQFKELDFLDQALLRAGIGVAPRVKAITANPNAGRLPLAKLEGLLSCAEVEVVSLDDTDIDDAMLLRMLNELPHLKTVFVSNTRVTSAGVKTAMQHRPRVVIIWSPGKSG